MNCKLLRNELQHTHRGVLKCIELWKTPNWRPCRIGEIHKHTLGIETDKGQSELKIGGVLLNLKVKGHTHSPM